MNRPIDRPGIPYSIESEIDRLVDGELDEPARRDLLRRLEVEPGGWRRCALAFLEAREFAQAARSWKVEHAPATRPEPPRSRRRMPIRAAALAASVSLAFVLGLATGGRNSGPGLAVNDRPPIDAPAPITVPEAAPASAPPEVSRYVQALWERRGYQVEPARRLVSMELDDGRRVEVPVDGLNVKFVGRPTY